jgi:ABC-type transport system involved in multi-copper enzyme maturation permease subunit
MSLVRAERRRLHKRRVTKAMLFVGVALLALIATGMWFSNHKVDDAARATAAVRAQQDYEQQRNYWENGGKASCEAAAKQENIDPEQMCGQGPRQEDFRAEYYMPSTYDFKRSFVDMATVCAMIMTFVGLIIGASYVGAEWSTGGMMNLLTWQPRRMRVLGTKMAVVAGAMVAWSAVVFAVWVGVQWLIATYRGTTAGMTSGTWQSFGLTGLRGLGLVAGGTLFGFVLASLGRRTAVAMGVLIGLIVVTQFGLTAILFAAQVRYPSLFFFPTHVSAWMQGKVQLQAQDACANVMGICEPPHLDLTWQLSGTIVGSALLVLILGALWQIKRRDEV